MGRENKEFVEAVTGFSGEREGSFSLGGVRDSNGVEIKCGDLLLYYEVKKSYITRQSQDGWGRPLILPEPVRIESKQQTLKGTVKYSSKLTGFVVKFEGYLLDTARNELGLVELLLRARSRKEKVVVVDKLKLLKLKAKSFIDVKVCDGEDSSG